MTTFPEEKDREEGSCSRPHIRKQAGTTSQAPWPYLVTGPVKSGSFGPTVGPEFPLFSGLLGFVQ